MKVEPLDKKEFHVKENWLLNITHFLCSLLCQKEINYYLYKYLSWAANSYQPGRLLLNYLWSIYLYPQNLLFPTIRDIKILESSGFHQTVDLRSLLCKFISKFENPSQKTKERNCKFCVRLIVRTIKVSNLRFAVKCRH